MTLASPLLLALAVASHWPSGLQASEASRSTTGPDGDDPALMRRASALLSAGFVRSLAWNSQGRRLAVGTWDEGPDGRAPSGKVAILDVDGPDRFHVLCNHDFYMGVNAVAWSPDGERLAWAGKVAEIWYVAGKSRHRALGEASGAFRSLEWSPDGRSVAASDGQIARVWTERGVEQMTLRGHTGAVRSVAWSPDGKRLATGGEDKSIKLWDLVVGEEVLTLRGHDGSVDAVAWSSDGRRLASGSADGTVRIWNASLGYRFEDD